MVNRRVGTTVVCGCRTGAHEALAVDAAGNSEVEAEWAAHLGHRNMNQFRQLLTHLREITDL